MSHEIEVRIVCNGACSTVHLEGDINWRTSPGVRAAILELFERGSEKRVIVDLKGAEHIDSIGASVLVERVWDCGIEKHGFHPDRVALIPAQKWNNPA